MKKKKIYLDTSVISFLFAEDSPDFKNITIDFFEKYSKEYNLYISEIVLLEINNAEDNDLREKMLSVIERYNIDILAYNAEIDEIASHYIKNKIIPESKINDALHVAYVTFYEIDLLLSWNFKHLANIKKENKILIENMKMCYYYPIRLLSPLEVQDEE